MKSLRSLALLPLLVLHACEAPSTDKPPTETEVRIAAINHDDFGGALSVAEYDQVEHDIFALIDGSKPATGVAPLSPSARADQIINLVKDHPLVRSATKTPNNDVMIQYRDGTPYLHMVGSMMQIYQIPLRSPSMARAYAQSTANPKIPGGIDYPGGAHPERESTTIPEGHKAILLNVDNTGNGAVDDIKSMLSDRGYDVKISGGTLEDLENDFKNVDVAWISSHGAFGGMEVKPNGVSKYIYVISTNTVKPEICEFDPNCRKRRDQMRKMQIMAVGSDIQTTRGWGFTINFILDHWDFNRSSFLFLSTCSGMNPGQETREFHTGLRSRNLGALLGWDTTVWDEGSRNSSKYFFDLALGTNRFSDITPKQRPFSLDSTFEYLVKTGGDLERVATQAKARMKYTRFTDRRLMLVPSGLSVTPIEKDRQGYIYGEFGDRPKSEIEVKFGGSDLTVLEATSGRIKVALPQSPLYGKLQVIVKKKKSNSIPLTLWQGQFSQKNYYKNCFAGQFGGPGIEAEAVCNPMRFRADVHGYRLKPGGQIMTTPDGGADVALVDQVKDTQCEYNVSGETVVPQVIKYVASSSLQGAIPWMHNEDVKSGKWHFILGSVNIDNQKLKLLFNYNFSFDMDIWYWDTNPTPGKWVKAHTTPWFGMPNILGMNAHRIQLNSDYSMPTASNVAVPLLGMGPASDCRFEYSGSLDAHGQPDDDTEH